MAPEIRRPDSRFAVGLIAHGTATIMVAVEDPAAGHATTWEGVAGTNILLCGPVHEQLRLLMDNFATKELVRLLSIQPRALHLLRRHLGMPTGATGTRGGRRPKAGRRPKEAAQL